MQTLLIITGVLFYIGLAIAIGRFLSLSTRGEIHFPLTVPDRDPGFYEPETTVNLPAKAFHTEKRTDVSREKSEKPLETISG